MAMPVFIFKTLLLELVHPSHVQMCRLDSKKKNTAARKCNSLNTDPPKQESVLNAGFTHPLIIKLTMNEKNLCCELPYLNTNATEYRKQLVMVFKPS